ncbi:MAG: ribosomal protein S18-alanine N-acetyltransferase [Clostridia bacterium]|nr:ribosomal protein S18-alanine N-acetyltransferase [Clostridia bacterium]
MTIREWRYEDIYRISELETEIFSDPWSYKTLATCFDLPSFYGLVAEEGGDIAGYGCVEVASDSADLQNIAVAEQFRRCGAGKGILEGLIGHCKDVAAREIYLEVRVSNTPALFMYLKNGFTGIYARPHYYSDGEDCIVMRRTL